VLVTAAVAAVLDELDAGRQATARDAYRLTLARLRPLAGAVIREVLIVLVLLLTVVGIPVAAYLLVRWAFATQASVIEKRPAGRALQRSAELVRGRWWRTFGITATVNVLAALSGPVVGVIVLLTVTSASLDAINLIGSLVYVFTIPLAGIAVTLLYFDLVERPASSRKRSISATVRSLGPRRRLSPAG
jgi:glycerophosphoryl diester phosphodiesterase family protein